MAGRATTVLWFRRDLRLDDHPALAAAMAGGGMVAPLFVVDERLLSGKHPSPNRAWFMAGSLRALATALRERGGQLHVRRGDAEEVVPAFAREAGAMEVHVSRDYTPFGRWRDTMVAARLRAEGMALLEHDGVLAAEPGAVRTGEGGAFRVFTPFKRRWEMLAKRPPIAAPEAISCPPGIEPGVIPEILPTAIICPSPGEEAAQRRLSDWLAGGIEEYADLRDRPDLEGSSRISQDLRWGLLSPTRVLERSEGAGPGRERFRTEVAWREFFAHLMWHYPSVARGPLQRNLEGLAWREESEALDAWENGLTGYPFVDAGMRQLRATGWMHNRTRMVVASFLAKDLRTDYRRGEAFFMRHLFDGDPASNNGGWQSAASTGADAQPYFRVFNPVLQGKKFDPAGAYVRRWVPELREVPAEHIQSPWTMTPMEQRAAHCVLGADYPAPIVDHFAARTAAIEMFRRAGGETT